MTRSLPYRDATLAARARRSATFSEPFRECLTCARDRRRTDRLARDLRAALGSLGIVLGVLTLELFLVSLAHGSFGRFEDSRVLTGVLVSGGVLTLALLAVAFNGRKPRKHLDGEAEVLVALTEDDRATCANIRCRARRALSAFRPGSEPVPPSLREE